MSNFPAFLEVVVGSEGGFTANPHDPGNWTGGACQLGQLKGTNFGISAASYPALDIANLTLAAARAIYERDFFNRVGGEALGPVLGLIVFDSAVNNGVGRASRWLQEAVGVTVDGAIGPVTLAAVARADAVAVAIKFHARRIDFEARDPKWGEFGGGWAHRLAALPFQAMRVGVA